MLLKLFEDGFKGGKPKEWLREHVKKGIFIARYIRADQFAETLNDIGQDISKQRDNG